MTYEEFLAWEAASRDTIDFKRAYVDMAGDLLAGLLLSQIVFWHLPDKRGQPKLQVEREGKLWLAKRRDEWWDEVRLKPRQFDRAIDILEQRGLVETAIYGFAGAPTKHIRINEEHFLTVFYETVNYGAVNYETVRSEAPISPNGEMQFHESVKSNTETTTETTQTEKDALTEFFGRSERQSAASQESSGLLQRLKAGELTGADYALAAGSILSEPPEESVCALFAQCWGVWPWPAQNHREEMIWEEFAGELLDRCDGDLDGLFSAIGFYFRSDDWGDSLKRITSPKGAINALVKIHHEKAWHLEAARREPFEQGPMVSVERTRHERTFWDDVLDEIALHMTRTTFDTWLKETTARREDAQLIVQAPNAYAAEWLEHRLIKPIRAGVKVVLGEGISLSFEVAEGKQAT